jgi:uncharacterized protein (TIRG00374 family)
VALQESDISKKFALRRVLIPILIGLGVAAWLLIDNFNQVRYEAVAEGTGNYAWVDGNNNDLVDYTKPNDFKKVESGGNYNRMTTMDVLKAVNWTWHSTFWMFVALLMMVVRDVAYMYRIRVLTDYQLSWRQSFDVIMLWEFASALTPSVVGGAGVAMFIVNREGIAMGRSTAIVLITALLDELFYIVMVPLVILAVGMNDLFPGGGSREFFGVSMNIKAIFWTGYFFILSLTLIILFAVFLRPQGFKSILVGIFRLPFLRRWKANATRTGDEIVTTSAELRTKPAKFWLKTFGATFFSWTARYWVVNFIVLAFISTSMFENMMIYARQLVMWVIMLISPTPGSSGVAEVAFSEFFDGLIPVGLIVIMAIIWRLVSYYPYLFIGAIILPRWLRKTAKRKAQENPNSTG